MNRQEILEKYNHEDKMILSKVLDKIKISKVNNKIASTDFLDKHEQKIIENMLNKMGFKNYIFFGGEENAERKVAIIYPEKLITVFENDIPNKENYLNLLRITLPKQLQGKYTHRDYLGGIMKTGIIREKIGDIIVYDEGADILVLPEVAKYLLYNLPELTRFSKAEIKIEELESIKPKTEKYEEIQIIVPSMRLDSIVSELVKTSRNKAIEIINQERVYINFIVEKKQAKEVKTNDIITIRGKGRYKIAESLRKTKNGNIVINTYKYV